MNRKAYTACNFNGRIESEGLLEVTDSHVQCKSQIMQDRDIVTTDHK